MNTSINTPFSHPQYQKSEQKRTRQAKVGKPLFSVVFFAVFIVAAVLLFSVACNPSKSGNTIRIGTVGKIEQINPLAVKDDTSALAREALFAGLFRWNDKWTQEMVLCESLPDPSDGSISRVGDGLVSIRYKLKDGLKWSDDTALDSYDLLFAYQMAYSPRFIKFNPEVSTCVKKAGATDALTATFTIEPGMCDFPPVPLSKKALERKLMTGSPEELIKTFPKDSPYSGAYTVKSFEPRKIVLQRNGFFKGSMPTIDNIEIYCFASESEMLEQFKKNKLDIITPVSLDGLKQIPDEKRIQKLIKPSAGQICLIPNLDNSLPSDIRFRKALMYAIKRTEMSKEVTGSEEFTSISWLSSRHPAAVDVLAQYSASPEKAQKLIEDMGYKKNREGKYEKDGILLAPAVIINAEEPADYKTAVYLKESLEKIGVGLDIKAYPPDIYLQHLKERKFPDFIMVHITTPPWVNPEHFFLSKQIPSSANEYKGNNYSGWNNSENDNLCLQFKNSVSDNEKTQILKNQQQIFAADLPFIPLLNNPEIIVHELSISNIKPRGFGAITWNAEEWIR
jgi:peptide/nickel transport system substrate-binding protein